METPPAEEHTDPLCSRHRRDYIAPDVRDLAGFAWIQPMSDELHGFLNRLKSLRFIDGYLLPELTDEQQREFMRDPARYITHTDRTQAEAIWREVQKRQQVTG